MGTHHSMPGLQVAADTAIVEKVPQLVAGSSLAHMPLSQRVWARVALRTLQAVGASAAEAGPILDARGSGHGREPSAAWLCAPQQLLQLGGTEHGSAEKEGESDGDDPDGGGGQGGGADAAAAAREQSARHLRDALRVSSSPVAFEAIGTAGMTAATDAEGATVLPVLTATCALMCSCVCSTNRR